MYSRLWYGICQILEPLEAPEHGSKRERGLAGNLELQISIRFPIPHSPVRVLIGFLYIFWLVCLIKLCGLMIISISSNIWPTIPKNSRTSQTFRL